MAVKIPKKRLDWLEHVARDAARAAFAPSVLACQQSAHRLVERMLVVAS